MGITDGFVTTDDTMAGNWQHTSTRLILSEAK